MKLRGSEGKVEGVAKQLRYGIDSSGFDPGTHTHRSFGERIVIGKNIKLNRGTVLLAELKSLLDSVPNDRRKEMIKLFRNVFTRLSANQSVLAPSEGYPDENVSFKEQEG